MAWAFLVEDGTGLALATSYVSVATATDYYAPDTAAATTWAALSTANQEKLLAWASRGLDQKIEWNGTVATETQGMRWPRENVYDRDGVLIESTEIPEQLVEAVCEYAKWLLDNNPTTGQDVEFLSRLRVDVVEIEWQEGTSQTNFQSILGDILRGLGDFNVGGVVAFNRIIKS